MQQLHLPPRIGREHVLMKKTDEDDAKNEFHL